MRKQVRPVRPSKLVDNADAVLTDYGGVRAAERGMYQASIRPPQQPLWRLTKFIARLCFYIIAPVLYLIIHERGGGRYCARQIQDFGSIGGEAGAELRLFRLCRYSVGIRASL